MNDETTLLSCPFCGGEIPAPTRKYMSVLICPTCNAYGPGNSDMTNDELIAAWNTRATHGTLTAEQVRKAVEGHGNIMDNRLYEDWQAVADELNATLGSGTCEVECFDNGVDEGMDGEQFSYAPPTWYLSCGHTAQGEKPNFCHVCGKRVER